MGLTHVFDQNSVGHAYITHADFERITNNGTKFFCRGFKHCKRKFDKFGGYRLGSSEC